MDKAFNNLTPAAPSGNLNVKWQIDAAGNTTAYVPAVNGVPTGGGVIYSGPSPPAGGNNNDFYFCTDTRKLYGPKAGGVWPTTAVPMTWG